MVIKKKICRKQKLQTKTRGRYMRIAGFEGRRVLFAPEIDETLLLIRQWRLEEDITVDGLKQKSNMPSITEKAIYELGRIHIISISGDGKISVNVNSFYESYGRYMAYNMPIRNESLESFTRRYPGLASTIKAKLLDLPVSCIVRRILVALFLMFFRDDDSQDVKNKISEIISSVEKRETWEMSPSFFQEWLESEIKIFIYFSRMAILNYPRGIVWESDILSSFKIIGYQEEDIRKELSYLCSVRTLSEYSNGTYAVWEVEFGIWKKIYDISSIQLPECKMP